MNLLMLLSALLSALTGVGAAVRRPEVAQSVVQIAESVRATRAAAPSMIPRAAFALPSLKRLAAPGITRAYQLAAPIAAWTNRRRE